MKVLLPISLDRWRNPISTLLRACVEHNPDIEFHSFSNPVSEEDRIEGAKLWDLPNLHQRSIPAIVGSRYDIIHTASYSHGNYLASISAKLRGAGHTRYLDTMNLEPHPSHRDCWVRYKRVLRWVDGFVAVSEAVAKDIRTRVPDRFLGVIPNGFDADYYEPDQDYQNDLPSQLRDIAPGFPLWVAALEPRKHPEIFVELAKANPDLPFVAIGGVFSDDARIFGKAFDETPNIHWLGAVDRKAGRAILSKAGVLVFPSEREGLSLAMIEATSMRLPILAQSKSSMPEIVTPGKNGELIEQDDLEGWNRALNKWLPPISKEQIASLQESRSLALEKFEWTKIGKSYGPVYKRILELPNRVLHPCPA